MKKAKKIVALLLCAVLLVGATIAGTVAYLTSQATVKNTFTVGSVAITMTESKVDVYGENYIKEVAGEGNTVTETVVGTAADATPVQANTYKLIPGHTYIKDPTITVTSDSEECYIFVKVVNGLGNDATITMNNEWTLLDTNNNNVWMCGTAKKAGESVVAFNNFTFANNADPADYEDAEIVVTAYAVQADGFVDNNNNGTAADEAWAAANFS